MAECGLGAVLIGKGWPLCAICGDSFFYETFLTKKSFDSLVKSLSCQFGLNG